VNRRSVLQNLSTSFIALPGLLASPPPTGGESNSPFYFPQTFGAKGDGKTLDSNAINAAIDRAHAAGGGTVYVGPGTYLCGTVVLRSRVTLYLEAGAVLLGSKDVNQYTPQSGPAANGDAGARHLLFARDAEDVTIAGSGLIDGQGKSFWVPSDRKQVPPEDRWQDVATLYWKPLPRVSPMIELVNCHRLHIEHVRIEDASGWTMRLINCSNVVVDGISIKNPIYGINVDGIDVTNCSDVRIANCSIETADDAICLKSENPYGETVPACRNIVVTNCTMTGCCNGFKLGTRTEGAFENITFSNSVIYNDDVDLNARIISGICLEMVDGGSVEGVTIIGIRMQRTRTPIFMRLGNRKPGKDGRPGTLRGVTIRDIQASGAIFTSSIVGLPGFDIEDIALSDIRVDTLEETRPEWLTRAIPEQAKSYPESRMFGRLPAWGLYCRHVYGLRLRDLWFTSPAAQSTPVLLCDDVKQIEVSALRAKPLSQNAPGIVFQNVQNAWLRDTQTIPDAPSLLHAAGSLSMDLLVTGCDLRGAGAGITPSSDFPVASIRAMGNVES
jgi:polygalacturonase